MNLAKPSTTKEPAEGLDALGRQHQHRQERDGEQRQRADVR